MPDAAPPPSPAAVQVPAQVIWRPVASTEAPGSAPVGSVVFRPATGRAGAPESPGRGPVWRPVPENTADAPTAVRWFPVEPAIATEDRRQPLPPGARAPQTPTGNAGPGEPAVSGPAPLASDYPALLRLGQLPVATFLEDGYGQLNFQQISPGSGSQGGGGGSGNQNYVFRADLSVNSKLLVSAFYTYNDDPLYARITARPSQPENFWTVAGGSLRARLAGDKTWTLAAEGSVELFTVGSGGCFGAAVTCPTGFGSDNIFNTSGQQVFTRNWIGSLSLPLSWNPMPRWQLSLTPGVSFLPATQGSGQGGAGTFYGTNLTVGLGSTYRIGDQLNLFSSVMVPLGPGTNAFNGQLDYYRVPIVTLGANYAVNPRIGLEASVTNGLGATPATAILALPSSPTTPMLSGRFIWTAGAPDSPRVNFTERQRSLSLGGVTVSTALLPPEGTTTLWGNVDSYGNLFGSAAYSVSNDFAFEVSGGSFGNAGSAAQGISPSDPTGSVAGGGTAASFLDTYQGPGNVNVRFGGKVMAYRPTQALPIWAAGRITVGRNFQSSSYQGYLFFETVYTWEATPWLAFNLNPKLSWSNQRIPWGLGLSANIQLGKSFQLIPELNGIATDYGGRNGTNGNLALRWLASPTVAVDVYAGNASGILDMGQLLGTSQLRVGGKVTVQF